MVDINEYTRETTCEYKGEVYSVRDNGAVMRHAREGKKARKLDNVWTFGTKDKARGYMMISSHRVHIIVAKAFIPGNEDGKMVVDHIDTNRCNNRVENLRWLTKLENVGSSRISGAWIFRKVLNLQHENCRCNMDVPSRWLERTVRDSPVRTN